MAEWPTGLQTQVFQPNIGINVGAEHTPIHVLQDSFNENATIAASDEFASTQRVERSSRQSVASTFPTLLSLGQPTRCGELWRSNEPVTSLFSHLTGSHT